MKHIVNIGAIGVGAFMARQHLPNILKNPAIRLHTLCDLDAKLLQQRAEEYKPEVCTTNAEEIFSNPAIDAVLVGTRSRQHAQFILMAAAHGKHVYVEKPMTMSYAETRQVLDAVSAAKITMGVGFNRRFAPIMVEAKRMFREYRQGPSNIVYRIVDDHRIRPHYIFDMNDGGGHLLQEGCHIFDLLAWFLDEEPVEVYAVGPLETDNIVILKFDRGSLAQTLAGVAKRVFLLHNVHESGPVVFETRWAMSYLSGPMSRDQIRRLAGSPDAAQSAAVPTTVTRRSRAVSRRRTAAFASSRVTARTASTYRSK